MKRLIILVVLSLLLSPAAFASGNSGWFGLGINVTTEGRPWSRTIAAVSVSSVAPHSPADGKGIVQGDLVLQLDGKPVLGSKAKAIAETMQGKAPGDNLTLQLKRADGAAFTVVLVAAIKPSKAGGR